MRRRTAVNGQTFNFSYDAESRLVGVSGAASATFIVCHCFDTGAIKRPTGNSRPRTDRL